MGMDVYGKNPTSKVGEYFRANVWWWRPLWDYVEKTAPWVKELVLHGQMNDGDGLDGPMSEKLAKLLEKELESGRTKKYAALRKAEIAALPDVKCWLCGGTGERTDELAEKLGITREVVKSGPRKGLVGACNGCNSTGWARPDQECYSFDEKTVKDFAALLKDCGGFEIW